MGGSSSTQESVQANQQKTRQAKNQQPEVSTLQSRKQQQMDEVRAAKEAREALLKAEQDQAQAAQDEKLARMKQEQEDYLAKQKLDDARANKQQPVPHQTPQSVKSTPAQQQKNKAPSQETEAQKMEKMKALMAEQKAKKAQEAQARANEENAKPKNVDKSPVLIHAHHDFNLNKNQVLGKPKVQQNQMASHRVNEGSDSEGGDRYNRQAPPQAQVFVAKVTTFDYNNQQPVAGTSQVTQKAQPNSVMAGFVQEDQLIADSENQRNIDLDELKDLLN